MLIPSIDLQNGHVVQLVQGEKLAIEPPSAEPWIQKFSAFPRVQLIDLDAGGYPGLGTSASWSGWLFSLAVVFSAATLVIAVLLALMTVLGYRYKTTSVVQ